jgi:hypothetical protein
VLADRKKRKRLLDGKEVALLLAQTLYHHLLETHAAVLPELETVCLGREDKWFLNAAKFATWLVGQDLTGDRVRVLALFGCAFAILQPADAPHLLQALLDRDPAFWPLLAGEPAPAPPARRAEVGVARAEIHGSNIARLDDPVPEKQRPESEVDPRLAPIPFNEA